MAANLAEVNVLVRAKDDASAALKVIQSALTNTGKAAEENQGKFAKFGDAAKKLAVPVAAASAAFGAFAFKVISTTNEIGGEIGQLQRQFGGTAEEASKLRFAFQQTGVGFDSAERGLSKFAKALAGVTDLEDGVAIPAGKAMTTLLKSLGVEGNDAAGNIRPMSDVLGDLAERFKSLPDGAEKTALATQLFGKSGRELLPFLNKGRDGLKALGDEAARLGLVLDQKTLDAVKRNKAAMREFRAATQGLQLQFGVLLLPAVTKMVKGLSQLAVVMNTRGIPVMRRFSAIIGPELQRGFNLTIRGIDILIDAVRDIPVAVTNVFIALRNAIDNLIGESNPLNVFATRLALAFGVPKGSKELIGFTSTVKALFREMGSAVGDLVNRFAPFRAVVDTAAGAIKGLRTVLDVAAFVAFAGVVTSVAGSLLAFPISHIINSAKAIGELVSATAGLIGKTISIAVNVAQSGFELLSQLVGLPAQFVQTITQKVFRSPVDEAKLHPPDETQTIRQGVEVSPTADKDKARTLGLELGSNIAAGIIGGIVGGLEAGVVTRVVGTAIAAPFAALAAAVSALAVGAAIVIAPALVAALIVKFRSEIGGFFRVMAQTLARAGVIGGTAFVEGLVKAVKSLPNILGGVAALMVAAMAIQFVLLPALIIRTIRDGLKSAVPVIVGAAAEVGAAIAQAIGSGIAAAVGFVRDAAVAVPQVMALAFREAVSGVITILLGIPQFVATLPERIAAGLKSLPRLMVAAIRGAPEAIVEVFTALPDLIAEAMRGIVDVTVDVLTEVANVFRFVFRAIVGIVEDPLGAILGVIQAAGTRFVEAFRAVWARVNEVTRGELNNALIGISDIFNDVIRTIASKLDFITAMMSNAWALIRDVTTVAWKAIVDVVTGPLETMKGAFDAVRTRVGWLADRIWQLIDAIKSIPSLPDLTPGFSIPSIPFRDRFAGGVRNFHGGMAMVGERGAELVRLPKGADVFSAGDTRRILKPQTAAATASPFQNYGTVNINVRATDTDGVMRELDRYFRQ